MSEQLPPLSLEALRQVAGRHRELRKAFEEQMTAYCREMFPLSEPVRISYKRADFERLVNCFSPYAKGLFEALHEAHGRPGPAFDAAIQNGVMGEIRTQARRVYRWEDMFDPTFQQSLFDGPRFKDAMKTAMQREPVPRKRGPRVKIPMKLKEQALAVSDAGGNDRDAARIIYGNSNPTSQQVKNVYNHLKPLRDKRRQVT